MADDLKVDESIDSLKARIEEEAEARRNAEQRAHNAERRAQRAVQDSVASGNEVQRSRMAMFDSDIEQFKTARDILKARLRTASAEGDHDTVAEATAEMGDVSARLLGIEQGKFALQQQIDNPPLPPGADVRPFNSLSLSERVERIAKGLSEKSAAWVRRHPEWAHSEEKVSALVGAHNASVTKHRADSDEYFADIERILEIEPSATNGVDRDGDARSTAARTVRARSDDTAPPAAPVRSGPSKNSRRLSATEQEYARIAGQSDEEYAASQDALVKEGRITRH